jgi:diguanylate cyclase (GGDEF)-like protein
MAEGSGNYLTMQMLIFNIGLDIYSFFVLLMISQYLQKNRGDGQEQILFRQVIRYTALALIGDLGSWIVNGRAGVMMHFLGYAFNMVYMLAQLAAAVGACRQLHYMCRNSLPGRDTERWWILAPCILIAVFTLSTPWTGLVFSLSPDNLYQRGILLPVFSLFTLAYVLAGSILALRQEKKEVLAERKQKYRILALYCLPPIAGSLIQTMIYGMSLVMPCSVFSLLLIFINEQHLKISADPLTGLNNRGSLDRYLYQQIAQGGDGLALIMLDINSFKKINDQYGHAAGDHALEDLAAVMKSVFDGSDAFLARYGGDEFAAVVHTASLAPETAVQNLQKQIVEFYEKNHRSFAVSLAAGYALYDPAAGDTVQKLIERADAMMYQDKQKYHR